MAGWLKEKETMASFLSNMGSTMDFKDQMYKVIMDWVPVTLEIGLSESWRAIKIASGLRPLVIKEVCWIKTNTSTSYRTKISDHNLSIGYEGGCKPSD